MMYLLLTLMLLGGVDCLCKRIFISGLDPAIFPFAHSHEGTFSLYSETPADSLPVYVHDTRPLILQFYSDEYILFRPLNESLTPALSIRIKQGYSLSSWLALAKSRHPFRRIIDVWIFHDAMMNSYHFLPDVLQIECADDHMHQCSANTFHFSHSVTRKIHGDLTLDIDATDDFTQIDGLYEHDRPVYRSLNSEYILFFDNTDHWVVAVSFDAEPILRIHDRSYHPEYIRGFWQVLHEHHKSHQWKERRHIKLLCSVSVQDVLPTTPLCSEHHNPCLNHASCYIDTQQQMFCLCTNGFTGTLCEREQRKCQAHTLLDNQLVAYDGNPQDQYVGKVAVLYCESGGYVMSVCSLDEWGNAMWKEEHKCPSVTSTDSLKPSDNEVESTPQPSSLASIHSSSSMTSKTSPYERPQGVLSKQTSNSSDDSSVANVPLVKQVPTWMFYTTFLSVMFFQCFLPLLGYLLLKMKSRHLISQQKSCGRRHVEETQKLNDRRDQAMQTLSSRYPGIVYNVEDAVFVKAADQYTEEEKQDIAAQYRNTYNAWKNKLVTLEQNQQKQLLKYYSKEQHTCNKYLLSMFCCFILLAWCIYWLVCFEADACLRINGMLHISLASCGLCFMFMLGEAIISEEMKFLRKMRRFGNIHLYIDNLKKQQPVVVMSVECFHVDLNSTLAMQKDAEGNLQTRVKTAHKKVPTTNSHSLYDYHCWMDCSRDLQPRCESSICVVKLSQKISFSDQQSFEQECKMVQDNNSKKDSFMNFGVVKHVDGFEDIAVGYGENTPWWLKSTLLYVVCSLLGLSWLFRVMFRRRLTHTNLQIKKTVYNSTLDVDPCFVQQYNKTEATKVKARLITSKLSKQAKLKSANNTIYRSRESMQC